MTRRPGLLVLVGVAVFVLGGSLVVASLRSDRAAPSAGTPSTPVVVATGDLPAGTTGTEMVEQGLVRLGTVPAAERAPDDLTSVSALSDETLAEPVAAGQAVRAGELRPDGSDLSLPPGDQAVAITLPTPAAGVAGYLAPGDTVDVYANVTRLSSSPTGATTALPVPCTELMAAAVPVVDVSVEVPDYKGHPSSSGRAVPTSLTLLLAADPAQAQQLVFFNDNESLYLTEAAPGPAQPPVGICVGAGASGVAR